MGYFPKIDDELSDAQEKRATKAAANRLIANQDQFGDWLGHELTGRNDVATDWVTRCPRPEAVKTRIEAAAVAQLMAIALGEDAEQAVMALAEIRKRYLAEHAPVVASYYDDAADSMREAA